MTTLDAFTGAPARIAEGQTVNGLSPHTAKQQDTMTDRGGAIVIAVTDTDPPNGTGKVTVEASVDYVDWFRLPYEPVSLTSTELPAPTVADAVFIGTGFYTLILEAFFYRFVRVRFSEMANLVANVDVYL